MASERSRRLLQGAYIASLAIWAVLVLSSVRSLAGHARAAAPTEAAHDEALPADPIQHDDGMLPMQTRRGAPSAPTVPALSEDEWLECPCAPVAHCADSDREQRCLEYLANNTNIVSVRPMVSSLRLGRTAKMRLRYKNPCVEAIVKMPQSLFPLEPYAEYVAFEIDRILGFGYVPPTTFTFLPIADIEAAAATFANRPRPKAATANEPAPTDETHEYAKWVSTEVLGFAMKKGLVIPHPETGTLVLGCSVQLFLKTVRPPQRTVLQEEDGYPQLLRSPALLQLATAEDAATQFTARKAMSLAGDVAQLIHAHRQRMRSVRQRAQYDRDPRAAEDFPDAGDDSDDAGDTTTRKELSEINNIVAALGAMNSRRRAALGDLLRGLSDQQVFDAIIGNDDRGPIKNANVYTVNPRFVHPKCEIGGRRHWLTDERAARDGSAVSVPPDVPVMRRVLLDQGKSFYKETILNPRVGLPLRTHAAECVFRRSTMSALQQLRSGELFRRLQNILPPQIISAVGEHRLVWASHRAEQIAEHVRQCGLALGGESKLAVWG